MKIAVNNLTLILLQRVMKRPNLRVAFRVTPSSAHEADEGVTLKATRIFFHFIDNVLKKNESKVIHCYFHFSLSFGNELFMAASGR